MQKNHKQAAALTLLLGSILSLSLLGPSDTVFQTTERVTFSAGEGMLGLVTPASCGVVSCDKGSCTTVNYAHDEWGGACSPPASPPDASISQDKSATVQGELFTVTYGRSGGGDASSCELQRQPPSGGGYTAVHTNSGGTSKVSKEVSAATGTWTYRAQCSGTGSSSWVSLNHALNGQPPSFIGTQTGSGGNSGSNLTINEGDSVRLDWACSAVYNTSASSLNFSTGGAVSGSETVTPADSITYTVACDDSGSSANVSVNVLHPTLSISASPTRVRSGNASVISWSASNVNSCSVTGPGGAFGSGASGSQPTGPITGQSIYRLACTTDGGSVSASITVTIAPTFQEI